MPRGFPGFSGGLASLPRATRWMLVTFVLLSVADAIVSRWLGGPQIGTLLALVPVRVLGGELWRLLTYPFLAGDPLALVFGVVLLVFFAGALERRWGRRRFLVRSALFAVVPALLTVAAGLVVPSAAFAPYVGLSTLSLCYLTAFASEMRDARVTLFPLPLVLTGDQLLWFEGGVMLLWMLFAGTAVPFLNDAFAFAFALAWFRFDWVSGLRRRWLRLRRGRLESRVERLARERRLRVVRSDDDDEAGFLH